MIKTNMQIRNSTAEFLIFQIENRENGVEVLYQDDTIWLTQDAKAFAESEFEKYRVIQDRIFESDFDRSTGELFDVNKLNQ